MNTKLYVANVPSDTTEASLRRHFATCGGVMRVDLRDELPRRDAVARAPQSVRAV